MDTPVCLQGAATSFWVLVFQGSDPVTDFCPYLLACGSTGSTQHLHTTGSLFSNERLFAEHSHGKEIRIQQPLGHTGGWAAATGPGACVC